MAPWGAGREAGGIWGTGQTPSFLPHPFPPPHTLPSMCLANQRYTKGGGPCPPAPPPPSLALGTAVASHAWTAGPCCPLPSAALGRGRVPLFKTSPERGAPPPVQSRAGTLPAPPQPARRAPHSLACLPAFARAGPPRAPPGTTITPLNHVCGWASVATGPGLPPRSLGAHPGAPPRTESPPIGTACRTGGRAGGGAA